ncbi:hypothetical protein CG51_11390 [Haematobacter missouriensis]|uniref:Acyltransferase n=1 Tax=Haematobacter missouriensis TaxID=366616 RepID=A0ABX3ZTY7_9RHOB|nr:acyltransferase family protein [Haematobacter missouriensis]KFI26950.1 hypothetical protein CG51_11390 [Haematobacter missouriensis]OWJ76213.1 acyltransferase [Haematobacter missouriensis]
MKYRADIAGLRAVAVLPILLFHAGVNSLPGGFVGVDIFFVISGFLITGIIVRELDQGRFTITEFYRRRVARIVPALVAMLLVTLLAGYVVMLPSELAALGGSAAWASLFLSNVHFYMTADYFGAAAETTPLLHTWSLAVEEQFYIFYPPLMMLLWRWRRVAPRTAVAVVCLLSFAVALLLGQRGGSSLAAAFYLIPSRAWELGLGALVALGAFPVIASPRLRQGLAVLGLLAILVAIRVIHPGALFPAPLALLPCLGAALLIAYGQSGVTAGLLSSWPMRRIGDISYSLYLWHWPVITFYRIETGIHLSRMETVGLVLASFAVAIASYVLIEKPALARLRHGSRLPALRISGFGLAVLVGTAALSLVVAPLGQRFRDYPPDTQYIASFIDYRETKDYAQQFRKGICFMGETDVQTFNADCLRLSTDKPNVIVLGDSHAAQYWRAFADRYPAWNVIQATASGCRPLLDARGEKRCTDLMAHVFAMLEAEPRPPVEAVVLAGRWLDSEAPALVRTVAWLKERGPRVLVIGPTVEYDGDFPVLMARAGLGATPAEMLADVEGKRLKEREALDARLAPLFSGTGATYVSVYRMECPAECLLRDQTGEPFHFDYGHLTLGAARQLVGMMPAP